MKERYHGKHTEGGERPRRAKRPPLTKKQKWLIAVAAVLAVALVIVIAWQLTFVKPTLPNKTPDGSASSAEGIDYGDGVRPLADGERKSKDFYTVLILGLHSHSIVSAGCQTCTVVSYSSISVYILGLLNDTGMVCISQRPTEP